MYYRFLQNFHQNLQKSSGMSQPSFFRILPTKESALIPLGKYQIMNTKSPP
jgi:hypothetical protein